MNHAPVANYAGNADVPVTTLFLIIEQ